MFMRLKDVLVRKAISLVSLYCVVSGNKSKSDQDRVADFSGMKSYTDLRHFKWLKFSSSFVRLAKIRMESTLGGFLSASFYENFQ